MSDGWTPDLVRELIAATNKQTDMIRRQTGVLVDLHDVCEGLRHELKLVRSERERYERLVELLPTNGNGGPHE